METPTDHKPGRSSFTLNYKPPTSLGHQENMSPTTPSYYPTSHTDHSYYSYRSAPSTPGLLSHHHHIKTLPPSLRTTRSKTNTPVDLLPRSRSTTHLQPQQDSTRHRRHQISALRLTTANTNDSEWVFHAGATIASEVGESKGQRWLSQRASSTSLVRMGEEGSDSDSDNGERGGGRSAGAIEMTSPWEVRRRALEADARSRTQSRVGSRMASRAQSTRGSRSSSRADLQTLRGMTPTPGKLTMSAVEDYFGADASAGRHVDVEEEVDELYQLEDEGHDVDADEVEVARLTSGRSLGLGSWVDGFMNWVLFDDVEDERLRTKKNQVKERDSYQDVVGSGGQRPEERAVSSSGEVEVPPGGEGGILKDAAWLLGVASRIIL